MPLSEIRTRFAPTPSGFLHTGNAVNLIITWARARLVNGHILLRIDDADSARVRPEYIHDVFESLQWLGLDWDIGPHSVEEFTTSWSQQLRKGRYLRALQALRDANLVFGCTCSRAQIRSRSADMHYTGTCLYADHDLDSKDVVWRLKTPPTFALPYPVVRQRDGEASYNLISVVDDVDFSVSYIVRGEDLLPVSQVQQYLASQLTCLSPFQNVTIEHHPLVLDGSGRKLSKSDGAQSLKFLRSQGTDATQLFELAGRYLSLSVNDIMRLRT